MPAVVAPLAAKAALAAPAVGAGLGSAALGTGLAAGASLAGAGLFGKLGLSTIGTGLGGLAPAAAAKLAPAAAAQAAGTIGTAAGSVAPSMLQSTGLEALKGQVIGTGVQNAAAQQATNLAFQNAAAQNMAGGLASKIAPQVANAGGNAAYNQVLEAFSRPNLGQGFPRLGPDLAGPVDPLAFQSATRTPSFLNTTVQGSALPGVTSNLPSAAAYGNTVGGPAIPGVTSGLQTAPAATQIAAPTSSIQTGQNFLQNLGNFFQDPSMQAAKDYAEQHPYATAGIAGLGVMGAKKLFEQKGVKEPESNAMIRPYTYDRTQNPEAYAVSPMQDSSERDYFNDQFIAGEPYKVAGGGVVSLAVGGPVEQMAAMNSVGMNTGYPMAGINTPMYSNPTMQRPEATNVIAPSAGAGVGAYSGEQRFARGGEAHLGDYSDGGRLLRGPGDGVSDSIPASIGNRQPARLADGEFVVPARIVSELGNGSTEAGARKLYAMMDRVQKGRRKSVGKGKVAVNSKADKYLPA